MLVIPPGWWYALACKVTWFKFHKPRTPKDFQDTAGAKNQQFLVNEALRVSSSQEKVVALQMQSLEKEDVSFAMSQMLPTYAPLRSSPECAATLQFLGG